MKRGWVFAGTCTIATLGLAVAQDNGVQAVIGNVFLQNTTPGNVQAGHASIGGTFRAGQVFVQQSSPLTIPIVGNNTSANSDQPGGSFSVAGNFATGVRATATSPTGTTTGLLGTSRSDEGIGVLGLATRTAGVSVGVFGQTFAPDGYGLRGKLMASTGSGIAVFGEANASTAKAIVGENTSGTAVEGRSRTGIAVSAISIQPGGIALRAVTIGDGNGTRAGEFRGGSDVLNAFSVPTSGATVALTGEVSSPLGVAVKGIAPITGSAVGVLGIGNAANGFGVFSAGRFGASGTKNFVIDHPLDPENKYLVHYSAEGPEPRNVYMGRVTTDARGYAWIDLPSYYASINRDPEYLLTVLDSSEDFVLAKVTREIENGRFQIRTNKPQVKVSWRVDAVRDDRWVRANGAAIEPSKPSEYRGTYLQPELYGKPQSSSQFLRNAPNGQAPHKP